jgi:hypothetical protein
MNAVKHAGAAIGDLAAEPGGAASFFAPLKTTLAAAAGAAPKNPAGAAALTAAEDFVLRLERTFSDMARLETPPDAAARHALLCLTRACALTPRLVSLSAGARALSEAMAFCRSGRKALALTAASATGAPGEFTMNIKFSTIYSGLDSVFYAFERCAEALKAA